MTDMLEDIFKRQKEVDEIIRQTKKSQGLDFSFNESEWIDRLTTAIIAEAVELKEASNWKWWKKPKEMDKDAIIDEMADILHMWVSLCWRLGISPRDIYKAYVEKNEENRKRQQRGY